MMPAQIFLAKKEWIRRFFFIVLLSLGSAPSASAQISITPPAGGAGSGNVSNTGTPTAGQIATWVNATTIQGLSTLADARLSSNVPLLNAANIFTGTPQTVPALALSGTAGLGYIELAEQSSAPSTPTNATRLFVDSSNRLGWKGENGFLWTLDGTSLSADRAYTLPNASITVAGLQLAQTWTQTQNCATITAGSISINSGGSLFGTTPNAALTIAGQITTGTTPAISFTNGGLSFNGTGAAQRYMELFATVAPTSGSTTVAMLSLIPTINQTGSASGITRGIYVNPTLTSAADWRAIEVVLGKVIIVPLASSSGVRYACFDTAGLLVSQAAACVGT
jgi:hypothetical protein